VTGAANGAGKSGPSEKICQDRQFYAYGTQRIFERRAARYGLGRTWITYLGVAVPLFMGAAAMAFELKWFHWIMPLAGAATIAQLVISLWSIVARWDEKYERAVGSARANAQLFAFWKGLLDNPPPDFAQSR